MNAQNYKNFTFECDDNGVIRVVLDVPGRPMNVLDHSVMTELDQIVTELEHRRDATVVVFQSGKESGFLAGADVESIGDIQSDQQAEQLLLQGQRLFARIEQLPMLTLVLIHGPCLGGGLELSLACDYRVARNNSSTQTGLPEIKLGVIPGWGGTQRLPKTVGIRNALDMILTGKHLSARAALKVGLIDRAIAPEHWNDEVRELIHQLASTGSLSRAGGGRWMRWLESTLPLRALIFSMARKQIIKKAVHYPALESAIDAVQDGFRSDVDGYETERRQFSRLINTPTCRHLLRLFFSRQRARDLTTWSSGVTDVIHQDPIRKLGVIGAGAMGAGIGQVAATRGYRVFLKEIDAGAAQAGRDRIDEMVHQYGTRKGWNEVRRGELRNLISVSDENASLASSDCVVEAVVERMDVKKQVLSETERTISHTAILATNTSSLSVSRMATALERPENFAGLHFFNPVYRMELVEVVRGEQSSETTIAKLVSFVKALGKTPIVTSDSPGFLVNRILFPYLGEAVIMLREGFNVAEIDREVRRYGMPMGPLELLDHVGLDVALHVAETMRSVLTGVDEVIETLKPMVLQKQTGTKSKLGFYDYSGRRKTPRATLEIVGHLKHVPAGGEFLADGMTDIQRRLIYPMLAEAIRCDEESVVDHPWAIDLGMVLGTGFAPHRGGPLSVVDAIGAETVLENLNRLHKSYGERFAPPKELQDLAVSKTDSGFYKGAMQ
ncbi:3-hydroxyacyl-CoA dehydrogenase NAD-binding domain-containing protein [Stieleria sp. TO1_6]|uniref:3-hydroxyacyl-CoA dehydrogenase NAD-binding domain-containing protein n=1 Tax=Stieleria tagensis TaxID=2956795 RepID=UPI00209BA107|nr:3-hydroxyacyl-CoA dehydrogenase NAD-binding domain-containing protein [Stieleria tagensis]MCO8121137.1 3-hydroxyacyl-CoA dehydrogenase NAD-binding domain-containing protein [Stieleria tagensis]